MGAKPTSKEQRPELSNAGHEGVMIHVTETAMHQQEVLAMNEALIIGSLRQHENTETAERLTAQFQMEIKAREDSVRELEKRAAQLSEQTRLLDLSREAIVVRSMDGEIRYWNHGAEELYGWTRAEAVGQICHVLLQTEYPTSLEQLTEVLFRTGHWSGELVHSKRDGQRITVLAYKTLDRDSAGNPVAVMETITDITPRRALENSLAARAAELVQADRSKDEFLAMLAHELRNPLAPLRNAAEILRTPGATPASCAMAQAVLARQIENMTRMIDDLLDVSRITKGHIDLQKTSVALDTIVTASANLALPGIKAREQQFTITLPAEPIILNADATRLEQVFGNLLGNACKYSAPGCHISLIAERAVTQGDEPPQVIVRVRDDGTGIAPEVLPHVFGLFVQATRSLDRAHGGLGIGLTLVKRLVEMHGGSVEACSEGLGYGSEFIVRLPTIAAPIIEPTPPPAPPAPDTPRRMLIVDDNADSVRTMAVLQRLRGHETHTAFTGPGAVEAAIEFAPNVVLLDIGLPGMDGYEVARRLRAMPALAGVLLVAMTGYDTLQDRARATAAGFDHYLVKPVNLDLLREWLRGSA